MAQICTGLISALQVPVEQAVNTIMLVGMGICGHPHRLKKIQLSTDELRLAILKLLEGRTSMWKVTQRAASKTKAICEN